MRQAGEQPLVKCVRVCVCVCVCVFVFVFVFVGICPN